MYSGVGVRARVRVLASRSRLQEEQRESNRHSNISTAHTCGQWHWVGGMSAVQQATHDDPRLKDGVRIVGYRDMGYRVRVGS